MVIEEMNDLLLSGDSGNGFKPIKTLPVVACLVFADITVLVTSFVLPIYHQPPYETQPSLFSTIVYLQISLWVVAVFSDHVMTRQHQKSQLKGYLEFNRSIAPRMKAFLTTFTTFDVRLTGSMLMLTSSALAWDNCSKEGPCSHFVPLTPAHFAQIILSLQTCVLLPVSLAYGFRVHQFNSNRPLPDILEGQMVYSLTRSLPPLEDVGMRNTSDDTLLEKQAEAIHFLKEHNARLSRKILSLTDQLGRYSNEPTV